MKIRALIFMTSISLCSGFTSEESEARMGEIHAKIEHVGAELSELYAHIDGAASKEQLSAINSARAKLYAEEKKALALAKELASQELTGESETYAYWNSRELTVEKLFALYGPKDAIYLIPPELAQKKVLMRAGLALPQAVWGRLIGEILSEQGIEIESIGPFVKALRTSKENILGFELVTNNPKDFEAADPAARGALFLHTGFCETKKTRFLESMAKGHNLVVQLFEQEALIIGRIDRLRAFAKLTQFMLAPDTAAEVRTYWTKKLSGAEAKKLLEVALSSRSGRYASSSPRAISGLKVFASSEIDHLVLLCGVSEQIDRALAILEQIEGDIEDPGQKRVVWYQCKHASPEDLAALLSKVYPQLCTTSVHESTPTAGAPALSSDDDESPPPYGSKSPRVAPVSKPEVSSEGPERFIVDATTSSLIMIVEREKLGPIEQLLERLDVPKQMVKIEVLLFEKKTNDSSEFGLESLKVGGAPSHAHSEIKFDGGSGILNFLLPKGRRGIIPAYDLAYKFLLSNRDLRLNSCPSITTMNATPATISIMDEISIDNGITYIENRDQSNPRKSFSREKFGISITLTPTINPPDPARGEDEGSITLESNINFESIHRTGKNDRPDVTKRHVENQVRIQNGQTVIIGGLRKKNAEERAGKLPFLGQIPGLGKLFSFTETLDEQTEMFIFITPRIISSAAGERERLEKEELARRPGDIPDFIRRLNASRRAQKEQELSGALEGLMSSDSDDQD